MGGKIRDQNGAAQPESHERQQWPRGIGHLFGHDLLFRYGIYALGGLLTLLLVLMPLWSWTGTWQENLLQPPVFPILAGCCLLLVVLLLRQRQRITSVLRQGRWVEAMVLESRKSPTGEITSFPAVVLEYELDGRRHQITRPYRVNLENPELYHESERIDLLVHPDHPRRVVLLRAYLCSLCPLLMPRS